MAEVIHEREVVDRPIQTQTDSGGGFGLVIGLVLLLVVLYVLFAFGLPALRSTTQAPSIQVPGKIDVNVNNPGQK